MSALKPYEAHIRTGVPAIFGGKFGAQGENMDGPKWLYTGDCVARILDEAHAHYEAQVVAATAASWRSTLNAAATVYPPIQGATAQGMVEIAARESLLDESAAMQVTQRAGLAQPDAGPTAAQLTAGAQAMIECGLCGTDRTLKATADSVWRAMQEVKS